MVGSRRVPGETGDEREFEEPSGALTRGLGSFVPAAVARRAVAVSVSTDRDVYDRGEPVEITVAFRNRLPVPVSVPTPTRRRWGWTVDDLLEASDERLYVSSSPSAFDFGAGERKRVQFVWNGRFERTEGQRESVLPSPGEHEIAAFVATDPDGYRSRDSTTITIR